MSNNTNYFEIDDFIFNIDRELSSLSGADQLLDNLEKDLKKSVIDLKSSDEKAKRQLAATVDDAYYTDILAQDDSFHVRTIALCNPATSTSVLNKAAQSSKNDKYTLMIIAHNPNTSLETLNEIIVYGGGEEEIRNAVLQHPNCNDILRLKIEDWTK